MDVFDFVDETQCVENNNYERLYTPDSEGNSENLSPNSYSQRSSNSTINFSQKSFSNLNPEDYIDIEYHFITGSRANSTLLYSITEKQIYSFNTKCALGRSYLCTHIGCKARVYIICEKDNAQAQKCIQLRNFFSHAHGDKLIKYTELIALNEVKRRCSLMQYQLTGNKVSVLDIFNAVMAEEK